MDNFDQAIFTGFMLGGWTALAVLSFTGPSIDAFGGSYGVAAFTVIVLGKIFVE